MMSGVPAPRDLPEDGAPTPDALTASSAANPKSADPAASHPKAPNPKAPNPEAPNPAVPDPDAQPPAFEDVLDGLAHGPAPAPMSPRAVVLSISGVLTAALLLLLSVIPAPYAIQDPGPTVDTLGEVDGEPLIQVDGAATYATEGELRLTTVSVSGGPGGATVDALEVVRAWLSGASAVVPVELVFPVGISREERNELAAQEMTTSQENATAAALTELGYEVPAELVVAGAVEGTGSDGVLLEGDVLVSAGGVDLVAWTDLTEVLTATPPGTALPLEVLREGERTDVEVVTGDDGEGGSVLGVFIDPAFDFPVDVTIRIDEIGGPSAGTMFALGLVDMLTPGALTGGENVAGTGTITIDGEVGPIGGIRQKLAGAARDGAAYFLAPAENCAEVVGHVPTGLKVVPVASLAEATDALTAIGAGDVADLPACAAG